MAQAVSVWLCLGCDGKGTYTKQWEKRWKSTGLGADWQWARKVDSGRTRCQVWVQVTPAWGLCTLKPGTWTEEQAMDTRT